MDLQGRHHIRHDNCAIEALEKLAAFVSVKYSEPLAPNVTVPMTVQAIKSCVAKMS